MKENFSKQIKNAETYKPPLGASGVLRALFVCAALMHCCGLNAQETPADGDEVSYAESSRSVQDEAAALLKNAAFVKHFSGEEKEAVESFGSVSVGKDLRGLEYLKSLRRGGDGKAASFLEGGYVIFGKEAANTPLTGANGEFTLQIRMRSKWGHWRYDLISSLNETLPAELRTLFTSQGGLRFTYFFEDVKPLFADGFFDGAEGKRLLKDADFAAGRICVFSNLRGMDPSWWHEFTVRYDGKTLGLYVDGVLVAENFPLSKIKNLKAPFVFPADSFLKAKEVSKAKPEEEMPADIAAAEKYEQGAKFFEGDLDLFAVWNRALELSEIQALSEGARSAQLARLDYIGTPPSTLYMYEEKFPSAGAASPAPVWFGGKLNVYYRMFKFGGLDKWGLGAAHYKRAYADEMGVFKVSETPVISISEPFDCTIGDGDAVSADGKIYLFYNDNGAAAEFKGENVRGSNIMVAVSSDAQNFAKLAKPAIAGYGGNFCAFYDEDAKLCRIYLADGRIFESADFENWSKSDKSWKGKEQAKMSWVEVFKMGGTYYLLGTRYGEIFKSEKFCGPWAAVEPYLNTWLEAPRVAVMHEKTYVKDEEKALLTGVILRAGPTGIIAARDIVRLKNGDIYTVYPEAIMPEPRMPEALFLSAADASRVKGDIKGFILDGKGGEARAFAGKLPPVYRVTFKLKVISKNAENFGFGIVFDSAGSADNREGAQLLFKPSKKAVQFVGLYQQKGKDGAVQSTVQERAKIAPVKIGDTVDVEAVFRYGYCDIQIDGRRPIIALGRGQLNEYLEFFAKDCEIKVDDFEYAPFNEVLPRSAFNNKTQAPIRKTRRSR